MLLRIIIMGIAATIFACDPGSISCQLMRLARNSSLSGHITGEDGKPVNAAVLVYERNIVDGRRELAAMCSANSDAYGLYRCDHLPAGDYLLTARPQDSPQAHTVHVRSQIYGVTYYPSTTDVGSAQLIALSDGQSGSADISLRLQPSGSLRSHLDGSFLQSSFKVFIQSGNLQLPVRTGIAFDQAKNDLVVTGLVEGSYRVEADGLYQGIGRHLVADGYIHPGASQQISFRPVFSHEIHGTVAFPKDCGSCSPSQIEMRRLDGESTWHVVASAAADGKFSFQNVADGEYVFSIASPIGIYIAEVDQGDHALREQVLHLSGDDLNTNISFLLKPTKAGIAGTVDTSHIVANKSGVVLQNVISGQVTPERVDASGHFRYDNLAPGSYRLFAWKSLDQAEYRNAAYLAGLANQSSVIDVDDANSYPSNEELRMIE